MPKNRKPELYRLLKERGLPMTTSYMQYTTDGLIAELEAAGVPIPAQESQTIPKPKPAPKPKPEPEQEAPNYDVDALKAAYNEAITPSDEYIPDVEPAVTLSTPVKAQDPEEMPGQRLNTADEDQPIRIDEQGRAWFQEEVRKPAYPKPRGRRVLRYTETGVKTETVQNGEYVETFEVAGQGVGRPAEVKITLPSYQVGIYKDPRFPFRIHCYNEREGFNLFEVQEYYGGPELVPEMCKRIYIENDLCYDIRSVIRAIQAEHRQLQLAGKI